MEEVEASITMPLPLFYFVILHVVLFIYFEQMIYGNITYSIYYEHCFHAT